MKRALLRRLSTYFLVRFFAAGLPHSILESALGVRWLTIYLALTLGFTTGCGQSFISTNKTNTHHSNTNQPLAKYSCSEGTRLSSLDVSIRKQSRTEYMNTYKALLGNVYSGEVESIIKTLPIDPNIHRSNFQRNMTSEQLEIMTHIAFAAAEKLVANNQSLLDFFDGQNCVTQTQIADACIDTILKTSGKKVLRRPPSPTFVADLKTSVNALTNRSDKLKLLISSLFLSPHFLFHFSTLKEKSQQNEGETFQSLDPYEIASYISYATTAHPPDSALMTAADNGSLLNLETVISHTRRLLQTEKGKEQLRGFFSDWVSLELTATPSTNEKFLAGISREGIREEAVEQAKLFFDQLVWEKKASLEDLLIATKVPVTTSRIATLYGTAQMGKEVDVGVNRAGLLGLPAFNMDGGETSSLITRGVKIREDILCEKVPAPDFEAVSQREDIIEPDRQLVSNRDYWHQFTMTDKACVSCHSMINPLGNVLEGIDSLGRSRSKEIVFSIETGEPVATHTIVTDSAPLIDLSSGNKVKNVYELGKMINESYKGASCVVKKYFQYVNFRPVQKTDHCLLSAPETISFSQKNEPLTDVFVSIIANRFTLARPTE